MRTKAVPRKYVRGGATPDVSSQQPSDKKSNQLILPLQAWRGIFVMMIFILHICPDLVPFFAGGNECITFFVILSGFCLSLSNKEYNCSVKGIIKYSSNRIMKFYPLYAFVLLCFIVENVLAIIISKDFGSVFSLLIQVMVNVLLLQAFVPSQYFSFQLNGPAWYLSATSFFYIIFIPVITFIKKKKKFLLFIFVTLIILHVCIVFLLQNVKDFYFWTYSFPPFRGLEFCMGICLGLLFKKYRNTNRSIAWFTVLESIVLLLFIVNRFFLKYTSIYSSIDKYYSIIAIIVASSIIYVFAFSKGIISKVLSNKLFVFIGNISFEIYIVHSLAFEIYFVLFRDQTNMYLKTIIILFITLIIVFGYRVILRYIQNRRRSHA